MQGVNCDGNGGTSEWSAVGVFETEEIVEHTVILNTNGTEITLTGETVTLPTSDVPAECAAGWTFAGWGVQEINGTSVHVPVLYTGDYSPEADVTLYAVYAKTGSGSVYSYLKAEDIDLNDVVYLVCESASVEFQKIANSKGVGLAYTGTIDGNHKFTVLAGQSDGTFALKDVNNKYLGCSADNALSLSSTLDASTSWDITFAGGNAVLNNGTYTIVWDGDNFVGASNAEGQTPVQLLKATAHQETIYATSPVCECGITLAENETHTIDFGTSSEDGLTGVQPDCWTIEEQYVVMSERDVPQLYSSNGDNSLFMNFRCVYAMPELTLPQGKSIQDVKMELDVRQT